MANDKFKNNLRTIDSVSGDARPITPSDTDNIDATRALYVGASGDIAAVMAGTGAVAIFYNVPAGAVLPVRVVRINTTATTATNILGLY